MTRDELSQMLSRVYRRYKSNALRVIRANAELTDAIIENTDFLNDIPDIMLMTRVKYLMSGVKNVQICEKCGKPIMENIRHLCKNLPIMHKICSVIARKTDLPYVNRQTNPYYMTNPEKFDSLYSLISENMKTFVMKLKSKQSKPEYADYSGLAAWVDLVTPMLSLEKYGYVTKCRWILEGRRGFPICPICGKPDGFMHKKLKINVGYGKYCSIRCEKQDPNYWQAVRSGCIRNHGVEFPMQCPEISAEKYSKYEYEGLRFDSSSELIAFLYLRDNVDRTVIRCTEKFPYEFNGKTHFYVPDLYLPSTRRYIEVKGAHFFNSDGSMRQPFSKKTDTASQKSMANVKEQLRMKCAIEHGISLLKDPSAEMEKMRQYVFRKYGKRILIEARQSHKN